MYLNKYFFSLSDMRPAALHCVFHQLKAEVLDYRRVLRPVGEEQPRLGTPWRMVFKADNKQQLVEKEPLSHLG